MSNEEDKSMSNEKAAEDIFSLPVCNFCEVQYDPFDVHTCPGNQIIPRKVRKVVEDEFPLFPNSSGNLEAFADWVETGWTRKVGSERDDLRELTVMGFGLAGESGEVLEILKKDTRGDGALDREHLKLELGDVLHYLCRIAKRYGIGMNDVMASNIDKIETRRGKRAWETK